METLVKRYALHRIMLAVSRPEAEVVKRSRGGDQGIAELDVMALPKLLKKLSGTNAYFQVNRNAEERGKESLEGTDFSGAGAMPEFGDGYGRAKDWGVFATQLAPSGKQGGITGAGDLNQDIGINENGHQEAKRCWRFPFRSLRM